MTGETVCIEAGGADEDAAAARLALLHQLGHPLTDACLGEPIPESELSANIPSPTLQLARLPNAYALHSFAALYLEQPNPN